MKALLINGSPNAKGCTYTALEEVARGLRDNGVEAEIFHIGRKPIEGCRACKSCYKTGRCVIDDDVNTLRDRADEFDSMVVGSPVYYASASGQVTAFMDRLFYSGMGKRMCGKPGAAVVSCRRGGASAAFDQLNKYFTICGMPIVSSNYWNQIHGNTPEEAKQDLEGMQTMYTLGCNMAWLMKCIDAGKKAGIPPLALPQKVMTNYIR